MVASRLALVSSLLALLGSGCRQGPSEESCNRLLDHVIHLHVDSPRVGAMGAAIAEDVARQKRQLRDYIGKQFVDHCLEEVAAEKVRCALAARDTDGLNQCARLD